MHLWDHHSLPICFYVPKLFSQYPHYCLFQDSTIIKKKDTVRFLFECLRGGCNKLLLSCIIIDQCLTEIPRIELFRKGNTLRLRLLRLAFDYVCTLILDMLIIPSKLIQTKWYQL